MLRTKCLFLFIRSYFFEDETELYYLNSRYYDPETGRFLNPDDPEYVDAVNNNLFSYCENDCVNAVDPLGRDAIWLQDKDTVLGFGHTGLLLQDESGKWWHFYWGANRDGKKGKKGKGKIVLPYNNAINLDTINTFYSQNYNKKYERMIYFKGDFSKSVDYAKSLSVKSYNFVFNNCMQVSADVLNKGTFLYCDSMYKKTLMIVRKTTIPNIAYLTISTMNLMVSKVIAMIEKLVSDVILSVFAIGMIFSTIAC